MSCITSWPCVSILFRHLTVSQLTALQAVGCSWRNRIQVFFRQDLFALDVSLELEGLGRSLRKEDEFAFVGELLGFIFSCCTRLRILRYRCGLPASRANILQQCRSTELQVLDFIIIPNEAFPLPLICVRDAGYNLRVLDVDFGGEAPTNMEAAWEIVAHHGQSLETLRLRFESVRVSDTVWQANLDFITSLLHMRSLRSLDLTMPFPDLAGFEITPEADLERLHLADTSGEPPTAFLCRLLPTFANLQYLMLGDVFNRAVVDVITRSCAGLTALYVSEFSIPQIATGQLEILLEKLAEESRAQDAAVKWLPALELMALGRYLSSSEQALLEKIKWLRLNLKVRFQSTQAGVVVEDWFEDADFVYKEVTDLVWKHYDC